MISNFFPALFLFLQSLLPAPTYIHGSVGYPRTFNPIYVRSDSEKIVSSLLFRGLFKYANNELVPDLAEGYSISKDGLKYTVKLKDNIFWEDGKPITADDILFTVSKAPILRDISTEKIDKKTVRFDLPNKYSPFLDLLTTGLIPSSNPNINENKLNIIGSGDYKIARIKSDKGRIVSVTLITNRNNYPFKKLIFKFYENEEELFNAYKLGEINGFLSRNRYVWENMKDYRITFFGRYFVLIFNNKSKTLKNLQARKELARAIDYNKLFKDIIGERGMQAKGPLSYTWAQLESKEFLKFAPGEKKKENPKTLKFLYIQGELYKKIANFIKGDWEKLGYTVEIKEIPHENLEAAVRSIKDYDVLLLGQEVSRDPDRYVFWHSTQMGKAGLNFANFKSFRVDKALEEGRKALGKEERKKHYRILQEAFIEEVPAVFLYHPTMHFNISKQIEPASFSNVYYPWEIFKNLDEWKLLRTSNKKN